MNSTIEVLSSGLVYRNPAPNLRSRVAYHPSLTLINEKEFVTTFDIGEAIESLDYHTVLSRSIDGGSSWSLEGPLLKTPPPRTSHTVRTSRLADGTLMGLAAIFHRDNPDVGLVNRATFGFVPMDLGLIRSFDFGKSWSGFEPIQAPLIGPSWEICHPIFALRSGRWLWPTATWRGWNGEHPSGDQTVVFISDDCGKSWTKFGRIFDGREIGRARLEVSVIELPDGRVCAVGWVHDSKACKNFPSEYCLSDNQGETFSETAHTGFEAETCKLLLLRDGRIFCAYRRVDRPGLWATIAQIKDSRWINITEAPLWQGATSVTTSGNNTADGLSALKFGYPSLQEISDGLVMIVFWCQEACVTNIRWLKVKIS